MWLLASSCWVSGVLYVQWDRIFDPFTKYLNPPNEPSAYMQIAELIFVPPVGLLILGLGFVWVFRGFNSY